MLTPKQERFVAEYLVDLNAAAAARRAGYSERVANRIGSENLSKQDIAAAIAQAQAERAKRTQIDADWVLRRLADLASADLADIMHPDGSLKPVAEWPEVWRKGLIAGVEVFEEFAGSGEARTQIGWTKKVKIADRLKALEMIGRHVSVGAFIERHEHTGKGGAPIPVAQVNMTSDEFRQLAAEMAGKV